MILPYDTLKMSLLWVSLRSGFGRLYSSKTSNMSHVTFKETSPGVCLDHHRGELSLKLMWESISQSKSLPCWSYIMLIFRFLSFLWLLLGKCLHAAMFKKHIIFLTLAIAAVPLLPLCLNTYTYAPVTLRPRLPKAQSALIGQLSHRSIASILCGPLSACTYRLPPVERLTSGLAVR